VAITAPAAPATITAIDTAGFTSVGSLPPGAVRPRFYPVSMPKRPSRIELLELDIDLRLSDLWREADDITEWNLEIVAAFMRAAYGKGYCDALTEESPGELCHEHGYRVPPRREETRQT
jgi:hypothetical protein